MNKKTQEPGAIAGVIPVKDTSTSFGSAPPFDDDSPISGEDDALAAVDHPFLSRRLFL